MAKKSSSHCFCLKHNKPVTIGTLIFHTLWEANFSSFMAMRDIMNKMKGDEYSDESWGCKTKLWRLFLRGVAQKLKWMPSS